MATFKSMMVNAFALVAARFSEAILTKAQNGEFTQTQRMTPLAQAQLHPNFYPILRMVR